MQALLWFYTIGGLAGLVIHILGSIHGQLKHRLGQKMESIFGLQT